MRKRALCASVCSFHANDRRDCRTKETFRDGWVHTGDEVYVNGANELFVVDRIKVSLFGLRSVCSSDASKGLDQSQGIPR